MDFGLKTFADEHSTSSVPLSTSLKANEISLCIPLGIKKKKWQYLRTYEDMPHLQKGIQKAWEQLAWK